MTTTKHRPKKPRESREKENKTAQRRTWSAVKPQRSDSGEDRVVPGAARGAATATPEVPSGCVTG